jgi:hypothetical protein
LIGLAFILMLLPLVLSAPKAEASYTYVNDTTYPEIGWMDVKRVGWDFNPNELLLTVQYQVNIPNDQNHGFRGIFYLDTDQNLATGSPGYKGADYYVSFWYAGDGSDSRAELDRWESGPAYFAWVKDLLPPFGSAGGDTVEIGVPLLDIGSPAGIYIHFHGGGNTYDHVKTKYTYNTALEDRPITVDGNSADWASDTPDITDSATDVTPSWAGATTFYTTDGSGKLYLRIDLSANPPNPHPEEASYMYENGYYYYFDTDHDPSTGLSIGTIGADYRIYFTVATTHSSPRTVTFFLYSWSGTSWVSATATKERAIAGTCLEISILLSDMGLTGSSIVDVYFDDLTASNTDYVPNSGTFTATKASLPSRTLSEASALILSASANSVYFIYADPYRMVSSTAHWSAAFAAYDATAAGFVYGLCANTQRICYDSNASIVVAKSPISDPPFNYGKVLLSSKSVVVMGGPIPNWVVDYYERTGQTPLKYSGNATHHRFLTQTGDTVAALPASTDFTHNDMFVVMVFQDTNGNFVLLIYGLGWKGTFAGGIYFKEVIKPNLATYTKRAYVFRWTDAGPTMDGVPQAGEITKIYEWP